MVTNDNLILTKQLIRFSGSFVKTSGQLHFDIFQSYKLHSRRSFGTHKHFIAHLTPFYFCFAFVSFKPIFIKLLKKYVHELRQFARIFSIRKIDFDGFSFPVDTGRILNVHKTIRRRPGRSEDVLMYVQFTPCVQRVIFIF